MLNLMSFSEFVFKTKKNSLNDLNEAQMSNGNGGIFHSIYHKGDFVYLKLIADHIREHGSIRLGNDGDRSSKATEADAKFIEDLETELRKLKNPDDISQYLCDKFPKKANKNGETKAGFDIVFPSGFHFGEIFKGDFSGHGDANITTSEETKIKETLCSVAIALNAVKDDESTNNKIREVCEGKTLGNVYSADIKELQTMTKKFGFDLFISRNYVSSAIECAKAFYKFFKVNISNYAVERQKQNDSKRFYETAKKLGGPSEGDNWNPADIWLISKEFSDAKFNKTVNVIKASPEEGDNKLMAFNRYVLQLIDMNIIIPISLKKIEDDGSGEIGHCQLMVSSGLREVQSFETLGPLKFKEIKYMKNAKNKDVASGFYLHFIDGNKKEWNFTLWEKSNSGFTTELRDPSNANNKSGVSKELMKQIVKGFDDLSVIYNNGKFTKVYDDAKKVLLKYTPDLKDTFEFLENPDNIVDINKPLTVSNKAIFAILNSYIMIKNVILSNNTDIIYELYLAGLKIRDGFCPHYKIY